MKKEDLTVPAMLFEAIDIILGIAYIGLQIFYGLYYHVPVHKFVINILVMILVYIGLSILSNNPERLNRIPPELCVGNIRKYSLRMIRVIKFIFIMGLFIPSVCDVFGYGMTSHYNVIMIIIFIVISLIYEYKILSQLK